MTRRDSLAFTLAGLGLTFSARAAHATAMHNALQIVQAQIDNGTLHSAVLRVSRGDQVTEQAFGKAKADSMFLLGSITKPLTAMAVMVLVDQGEIRLSDPAVKYLPEFGEGARKDITLKQLLTHTSGLPDQLADNNALRARHAPLPEFVKEAMRAPLLFAPGTKYHYQSMGILLAAEIVQRVAKTPLPEFLQDQVFIPLGMSRTVLGLGRFQKEDMVPMQTEHAAPEAGGGDPKARAWDWNSDYWRQLAAPWGGAHSTAAGISKCLSSLMHPDGKVLREANARLMIQDHTPALEGHRGIGFVVGPAGLGKGCSNRTFGHAGSTGTLAWADPATDTTFVLLTALPKNVSGPLILDPVSEIVSTLK